ncbi:MAG: spore coat protein CotH [Lachnospiraceae bacterium]|nr:spore coat protein CotH [Lachnospiraceae bacterium]
MSTSKRIDQICIIALVFVIIITTLFINAGKLGVQAVSAPLGYEARLFNTSTVHSIDIVMDDWDSFIENCRDETYETCAVIIDGDAYKNVAIRAKGNTSLSQVDSYGNNRYSFKIEFDHYDNSNSYYGLDKLCLNNIIQDNTYMKDYLSYQLMGLAGADAPLCSYAYITVNGEDWGLYLAVEAVEDTFLQRNYGNDYGELYKPDSSSLGGGRGNGRDFKMPEDFDGEFPDKTEGFDFESQENLESFGTEPPENSEGFGAKPPEKPESFDNEPSENSDNESTKNSNSEPSGDFSIEQPKNFENNPSKDSDTTPPKKFDAEQPKRSGNFKDFNKNGHGRQGNQDDRMGGGMNDVRGSSDVSLIYTDDEYESYSNIFDNAKTDISDKDKDRLISSLKQLNEGENIDNIVDVEEVLRYFVVHNFVLNFDSYTGSMIHNYYLYEKDGQLSMIPWDYNLAFSGFTSGSDAGSLVNYPIDTPISGGSIDTRPMLAWIFNNEEYTELYHQYLAEFIAEYFDSGYFADMIDSVSDMISPYVEKDPTKFCTYEEFKTGSSALKEFCLLRAQSVSGQLNGTIPSTSDGQSEDSSSFINADNLDISSMGSMNFGGGGKFDGGGKGMGDGKGNEHGNGIGERDFNPDGTESNRPDFSADTIAN